MSRARMIRVGLLLSVLFAPIGAAEAAGPGTGPFASAPKSVRPVAPGIHHPGIHQRVSRHSIRHDGPRDHGESQRFRHGRRLFTSAGYLGPWAYPAGPSSSDALPMGGDGPQHSVDSNSFEYMPVLTGIMRAPTPEPTIYRLEGRRDRPATRVIRIGEPEPRHIRRSRFAHAETGALLLIVPGR